MADDVAFDAFINQAKSELEKDVTDETLVDSAVFAMQKAKLLFTGSPIGTILRNTVSGASATRAVNPSGVPLWQVSAPDGSKYDSHEPILTPESDWVCIYQPAAD